MLAAQYHETKPDHWQLGLQGRSFPTQPQQQRTKVLATSLSTSSGWQVPVSLSEQDVAVNLSSSSNHAHDAADLRYETSTMDHLRGMDVMIKEEEDTNTPPITGAQSASPVENDAFHQDIAAHAISNAKGPSRSQESLLPMNHFQGAEQTPAEWLAPETSGSQEDQLLSMKDEDDEGMEDEEEGDPDVSGRPLTAAERSAARRKMKRFRLTHQQTRFLMSEFVKQPHPDAAHRDRLSREIPGLSPRQVQVWFQNRRAKIKRMNAEDRDRVIKMRAVPEDFDNIQALHSPYGAVHGLGPNMASPSEIGTQGFGDALHRPLVVDVRRPEADDNLSPTGLTPAFESAGFGTVVGSNTDLTSPLASAPNDRFRQYGGPFSPSLASITANQSMLSGSQGRADHSSLQNTQGMRPLQPLHLRDSLARPRAEPMQSPLRSSSSWKTDSTEYPSYQFGGGVSATGIERQSALYQIGSSTSGSAGTFETSSYPGDTNQGPSDLNYSGFSTSPNQQRSRAASATFPLSLDLRNQYRGLTNRSPGLHSSTQSTTSTQYTSPSIYTTSYPPAPLTAPINIPQPRGGFTPRGSLSEHHEQQMSAPSSATADLSRRAHSDATVTSHTPMRDSFGGNAFSFGQNDSRNNS